MLRQRIIVILNKPRKLIGLLHSSLKGHIEVSTLTKDTSEINLAAESGWPFGMISFIFLRFDGQNGVVSDVY